MHVAIRVAYDGSRFRGLARQPEGGTVEDALLDALRHEGLVPGTLRCGSRTDAGVSALENVLKVELDRPHLKGLVPALQRHLPDGLWVTGAAPIDADWNVQHARSRTYQYLAPADGEDPEAMAAACAAFVGEHDFTAFARIEDRKATRPVTAFSVVPEGTWWRFEVTAPGFLWNQVRRMVDAVMAVGQRRAQPQDIAASLASGEPHGAFALARAEGLALARVEYDAPLLWADVGTIGKGRIDAARQRHAVQGAVLDALAPFSGSS